MPKRVEILSKRDIFHKSIFRVEEVNLRHERYDGSMSHEFVRLSLDRGDSVAAILHDQQADTVLLIEQIRYSAYEKGPGWMVEIPAGIVRSEIDASPEITMRREIMEEIGYRVETLWHINTFYLSPGGSSERVYLYYASVTPKNRISKCGGLTESGEDIRTLTITVDNALEKIDKGEIIDAKTVIGLQWLQAHRRDKPHSLI